MHKSVDNNFTWNHINFIQLWCVNYNAELYQQQATNNECEHNLE